MTLNDFLKRINVDRDKDKMIVYHDGKGWTNVFVNVDNNEIRIIPDYELIFTSDRE